MRTRLILIKSFLPRLWKNSNELTGGYNSICKHYINFTLNSNGQPNENSKNYNSSMTLGCYHLFYLSILF